MYLFHFPTTLQVGKNWSNCPYCVILLDFFRNYCFFRSKFWFLHQLLEQNVQPFWCFFIIISNIWADILSWIIRLQEISFHNKSRIDGFLISLFTSPLLSQTWAHSLPRVSIFHGSFPLHARILDKLACSTAKQIAQQLIYGDCQYNKHLAQLEALVIVRLVVALVEFSYFPCSDHSLELLS